MTEQNSHNSFIQEYAEPIAHTISSAVEITAAIIIGIAVIIAVKNFFMVLLSAKSSGKQRDIRIQFGSSVAVALELLLGADVIATAVAPT